MPTRPIPAPPPRPDRPPWPLYPKLVCVALLLGSFACTLVLVLTTPRETLDDWQALVDAVGRIFTVVIVPASFATVVFSLLLLARDGRWFFRQRWAQVKVVLLVVTLPALHLLARGVFTAIRAEVEAPTTSPEGPTGRLELFTLLVALTIAVLLTALLLARFKPRLGQRRDPPAAEPDTRDGS